MWTTTEMGRVQVTPVCLLLLAVLFYLDQGIGVLGWALLACALHELGHCAAAWALGGRVERLGLSVVGAELSFSYPVPPSELWGCVVLLAGPLANLLGAVVFAAAGHPAAALLQAGVGGFNLLPILPLDGGQVALRVLGSWVGQVRTAWALDALAGVMLGALLGIGVIAAVHFANVTLLCTALWLLIGVLKRGRAG